MRLSQTPLVSVVVPNYNHACYLPARLDSIFAQTFADFELIYLDDASSDNSGDVWAKYASEPRVCHSVINTQNSGSAFVQWNRGVALARGKYVWLAEADDVASVRFLEQLIPLLEANLNVGVVYSQSDLIDEKGRVFGSALDYNRNFGKQSSRWEHNFVNAGQNEIACYLARQCTLPNASAVLFRRDVYNAVGGADTSYRLAGDHLLWVQMLLQSDIAFVAEPLNQFRRHTGTVRHGAYSDGTHLEEGYKVASFIQEQVPVPPDVREAICDDLMDRWLEMTFLGLGKNVPPDRKRRIAALQNQVDPHPKGRALRRLWERSVRKAARLGKKAALPASVLAG